MYGQQPYPMMSPNYTYNGGMLSASPPNYSYSQAVPAGAVNNQTLGSGLAGLGTSFLNAYSNAQKPGQQPMQLGSAAPSPLAAMINGLLNGGGGGVPTSTPDPSAAGIY